MISERDRVYLDHILDCIALIQTYTRPGKADFMANSLVQDAVLRRLQTMAESTPAGYGWYESTGSLKKLETTSHSFR